MFFLRILLFISLFYFGKAIDCPNGTITDWNDHLCVYSGNQALPYTDVLTKCHSMRGDPIKITNMFENMWIHGFFNSTTYLGVERNSNQVWTYSDGSSLTYQNWAPGEPNLNLSNNCTVMDTSTSKWMAADCLTPRFYICSINMDQLKCPYGWVYNNQTEYCYYLHNFTYPDGVHWELYNVTMAELMCQKMDAHLVSIHSDSENDFVMELVKSQVHGLFNVAPGNYTCGYSYAYIGYYGNATIGAGMWTDGSPADYVQNGMLGDFYNGQIANDGSCSLRGWGWTPGAPRARFVCKKPSKD
ncbi:unnamed protein product, partial [Mesorhabditis belari]|uniref:C-type lectin domain-containing protein n=1 Tax=Mesorhabditis belari TaxID=2138241 RepID=A0AAF3F916_9BILA